jgi:hypothetical protein
MRIFDAVAQNVKTWLGEPDKIFQATQSYPEISSNFSALVYQRENHYIVHSLGASEYSIPGSEKAFNRPGGSSNEYIFHASKDNLDGTLDLLIKISRYPYIANLFIYSGMAFPIDETLIGRGDSTTLNYIYLTDPYEDDPSLYSDSPNGQISLENRLIFTLWAIPIYEQEYQFLRHNGAQDFDKLLGQQGIKAHDLHRKLIVV